MLKLNTHVKGIVRHVAKTPLPSTLLLSRRLSDKLVEKRPTDEKAENSTEDINVPWYLREDVASPLLETQKVELPEIPTNAPQEVSTFCDLLANKYGMTDIHLFDMTTLDDSHEFRATNKSVDYILICSGKSEKHNFKAATEFRHYLKHTYDYFPLMEGMVSGAMSPIMRRRLLRRASRGPPATANDYGKSANSWIMCHHENIDIHMMTKERREELNLESLWCKPEDAEKYAPKESAPQLSDHIFSGIRRLHTSAKTLYSSLETLETHLYQLHSLSPDSTDAELEQRLVAFNKACENPNFRDYSLRFQMYKTLHLIRPAMVTFEKCEEVLLSKYASIDLALDDSLDYASEKAKDVSEYMKLLLDSPDVNEASFEKHHADLRFQKLSTFIRTLYSFSNERFSMITNPDFIPLLWRLAYDENKEPVTPKMVDGIIHHGDEMIIREPGPSISIASKRARDVLSLVNYLTEKIEAGHELTAPVQELILFTYGNAGKWEIFWEEWNKICFSRVSPSDEVVLQSWLRLMVFLSLVNNRAQILFFFNRYWDNGSEVGGTVMQSLRANKEKFQSDNEKDAFKRAASSMLESLGKNKFEGIQTYIAEL